MEKLRVELGERSYEVLIDRGNIPLIGERLLRFSIGKKVALISNPKIFELYGEKVTSSLKKRRL